MLDRSSRATLAYSSIGHFYSHVFLLLYPTVVLALESVFSLPYETLIGLMLVANILFGVGAVPAGYLGDRWNAPAMMVVFFIGTGAASILTGLASSPLEVGIGLALIGLFASIYHPVGIAWVVRRAADRGKALGVNGLFGSLGTAAAPLIAAVLVDLWSWRAAFVVPGLVCVATGLLLIWSIRRGDVRDDRATVSRLPAESSSGDMQRGAIVLAITIVASGLIYQATSFAMPKLFETRLTDDLSGMFGDGLLGIGALVAAIYVVSGVAQLFGGWLADRFDLKRVYLASWAMQVPLLLLAIVVDTLLLVPLVAAMVFANITSALAENSLFARYTPPKWRGTAFGMKFLLSLGVAALAVPLIAAIYGATREFAVLLLVLAGCAVAATLAATLLPGSGRERGAVVRPAAEPAE